MTACVFPDCPTAATGHNRAGQDTCQQHQPVVVVGSYVDDRHTEGGHG